MDFAVYNKNQSGTLKLDFENAPRFGKIKVGQDNLYFQKILHWYIIPIDKIKRVYRRIEAVNSRVGCCSNDFSIHKLAVVLDNDETVFILIGESLYRHEPERLIDFMQEKLHKIL